MRARFENVAAQPATVPKTNQVRSGPLAFTARRGTRDRHGQRGVDLARNRGGPCHWKEVERSSGRCRRDGLDSPYPQFRVYVPRLRSRQSRPRLASLKTIPSTDADSNGARLTGRRSLPTWQRVGKLATRPFAIWRAKSLSKCSSAIPTSGWKRSGGRSIRS